MPVTAKCGSRQQHRSHTFHHVGVFFWFQKKIMKTLTFSNIIVMSVRCSQECKKYILKNKLASLGFKDSRYYIGCLLLMTKTKTWWTLTWCGHGHEHRGHGHGGHGHGGHGHGVHGHGGHGHGGIISRTCLDSLVLYEVISQKKKFTNDGFP